MDCPVGGEAVVQPDPCAASGGTAETPALAQDFDLDGEYWRREVAARLQRYRSRRKPREPRYPSLCLPFDSVDNWRTATATAPAQQVVPRSVEGALAPAPDFEFQNDQQQEQSTILCDPGSRIVEAPDPYSNVIEFPRSAVVPLFQGIELADPVLDRPRIVEAPEVLPPPPALGGMLIDSASAMPEERAPELPVSAATLSRRILSGMLDGLVLGVALVTFGAMFVWVNPDLGPRPVLVAGGVITWALFWAAYKFLFIVYSSSTPGMRLARLRVTKFDGSPVGRRLRRWRVLASYLSALSLGLGYLWSILDEDSLCWHDRITRTHLSQVA